MDHMCISGTEIRVTGKVSRTSIEDQEEGVSDQKAIVTFAICLGI